MKGQIEFLLPPATSDPSPARARVRRTPSSRRGSPPRDSTATAAPATAREALAECRVRFPAEVAAQLRASGLKSKKGGIVDTAIVAGTLAVKRTHELIPFCHPLPIDGCRIAIDWHDARSLRIECEVRTTHRTGVEMEALNAVQIAELLVQEGHL